MEDITALFFSICLVVDISNGIFRPYHVRVITPGSTGARAARRVAPRPFRSNNRAGAGWPGDLRTLRLQRLIHSLFRRYLLLQGLLPSHLSQPLLLRPALPFLFFLLFSFLLPLLFFLLLLLSNLFLFFFLTRLLHLSLRLSRLRGVLGCSVSGPDGYLGPFYSRLTECNRLFRGLLLDTRRKLIQRAQPARLPYRRDHNRLRRGSHTSCSLAPTPFPPNKLSSSIFLFHFFILWERRSCASFRVARTRTPGTLRPTSTSFSLSYM
ncbi:hypothetical protein HanPI659440_Chr00c02g0708121 [Helianthus annuus]|nr:hypothetical protein HanPI659440_Chr00c02g0708121 [Helianthus annuus]